MQGLLYFATISKNNSSNSKSSSLDLLQSQKSPKIIPAQSSSPSGSSATVGTAVVGQAVVGQA